MRPKLNKRVTRLSKQFNVRQTMWERFREQLKKKLTREALAGAAILLALQSKVLSDDDNDLIDRQAIARRYIDQLGQDIDGITDSIRRDISRKIIAFYNNPEMTFEQLIDSMRIPGLIGAARAAMIAIDQIGKLHDHVMMDVADQLGIDRWWWKTMQDNKVCTHRLIGPDGGRYQGCRALHGKIFPIKLKGPPAASHVGCRCKRILITRTGGYIEE
jgi:hypothetical protein